MKPDIVDVGNLLSQQQCTRTKEVYISPVSPMTRYATRHTVSKHPLRRPFALFTRTDLFKKSNELPDSSTMQEKQLASSPAERDTAEVPICTVDLGFSHT